MSWKIPIIMTDLQAGQISLTAGMLKPATITFLPQLAINDRGNNHEAVSSS
ncbi:hypothetical protein OF122_16405 [Pelagibacterium flavum]|uniref:Uncharacterized protein n=1 Tax=Pelagibacterium flavum TaxID=2984530 RepID=A0ABY6IQ71_9HYPH|nr:hypothetical protein [Pelagibacterium sp. YIM 151497]UYQ71604.1 hypothetical protein OF122_16405 [Pelagibacterium sp. YIM 151497]|tara:strand:- start:6364 stop:6516 length:153 start_codon:yes stop_codon:yes gene_type:complete